MAYILIATFSIATIILALIIIPGKKEREYRSRQHEKQLFTDAVRRGARRPDNTVLIDSKRAASTGTTGDQLYSEEQYAPYNNRAL